MGQSGRVLSLNPQNLQMKHGWTLGLEVGESKTDPAQHSLATQPSQTVSLWFNEMPYCRAVWQKAVEEDSQWSVLISLCDYTRMHIASYPCACNLNTYMHATHSLEIFFYDHEHSRDLTIQPLLPLYSNKNWVSVHSAMCVPVVKWLTEHLTFFSTLTFYSVCLRAGLFCGLNFIFNIAKSKAL